MLLESIVLCIVLLCAMAYQEYRHGNRINELLDALQVKETLHHARAEKLINAVMAKHLPQKAFSALVEKQSAPHSEDYPIMESIMSEEAPETPSRASSTGPVRPIDLSARVMDSEGFGGIG